MKKILLCFAIFCGLLGVFLLCPVAVFGQIAPLEKIFYLAPYNALSGEASLDKNWQNIDILAPQFYTVNSSMKLVGKLDVNLKKIIAKHNLKVMPLVTNASFSQKIIHDLLMAPNVQNTLANTLVTIAKKDNYIGWQFDFENINYQDKDLFTAFVQRVYPVLKKNNLIFSVAVVPRTTDYEDTDAFKNWGGAYDYSAIAQSCDFVSLMTYDDSNSVGPAASIAFDNNVLKYVKDKIPASKLSLGVPLYYWKWDVAGNKKIGAGSYKNLLFIMENFRYSFGFNLDLGVSWLTYVVKNKEYKIWFEDNNSFQKKLDIVKANNLRGFSAWLLGSEDPAIWSSLSTSH